MANYQIVLLLLGPTRSGKTTFVQGTGAIPVDGKTEIGSTQQCKDYTIPIRGKSCLIIDTPGFDDSPALNLSVLNTLATKLLSSPPVNGVIYFHRVTNTRLTGSARSNIDLFLNICGRVFYGQTAFVTTMWNNINPKELQRFENLNRQIQSNISNKTTSLAHFRKFDTRKAGDAMAVLDHFATLPKLAQHAAPLLFAQELKRFGSATPTNVRRTTAGKLVIKDLNRGFCMIL
ncbi:hypothetical protein V8F20_012610 [Naviculisporaceae sp. PSN 640]